MSGGVGDHPTPSPAIERWQPFIAEASERFGVSQAWIRKVMAAENAGETILDATMPNQIWAMDFVHDRKVRFSARTSNVGKWSRCR